MTDHLVLAEVKSAMEAIEAELLCVKNERSIVDDVHRSCHKIMLQLAQGQPQQSLFDAVVDEVVQALPDAQMCIISCGEEGMNWRIDAGTSLVDEIATPSGMMLSVPAQLPLLQTSLTGGIQPLTFTHLDTTDTADATMANASDWNDWQPLLTHHGLEVGLAARITNSANATVGLVLFFGSAERFAAEKFKVECTLSSIAKLVSLIVIRQQTETDLLNSAHFDAQTGLLNRLSFESNFRMMVKDARRHFQRLAVFSVNIHSGQVGWKHAKIEDEDVLKLADIMTATVRDNDLIARLEQNEFVMGVRIRNLEDAEIVAKKILQAIEDSEDNLGKHTKVALGVSFYPEHSSYDALLAAAAKAAKDNNADNGYRIEYHGRFCHSSAELYDF